MSTAKPSSVTAVYRHVIDDVVTRVRKEFVQEGVDEAVLDELRELWETKLLATGVLEPPAQAAPVQPQLGPAPQYYHPQQSTPAYYTGVPAVSAGYSAAGPNHGAQLGKPETFLQPTGFQGAVTTSTAAPVLQHAQQHLGQPQSMVQTAQQPQPQQPSSWQQPRSAASVLQLQHAQQAQQLVMQRQQQQQQQQHQNSTFVASAAPQQPANVAQAPVTQAAAVPVPQVSSVPVALSIPTTAATITTAQSAVESRKRPYEGSDQGGPQKQVVMLSSANGHLVAPHGLNIPQQDGTGDTADEGQAEENEDQEDEDDPLAGLSSDEDNEGSEYDNVVLAQFEKVSRTKTKTGTKWKCVMKNGIAHINGRDIIFKKCNGEMEF